MKFQREMVSAYDDSLDGVRELDEGRRTALRDKLARMLKQSDHLGWTADEKKIIELHNNAIGTLDELWVLGRNA